MKNSLNQQTDYQMMNDKRQNPKIVKDRESDTITSFEIESSIMPSSLPLSAEEVSIRR
jgi:hypothetical protein